MGDRQPFAVPSSLNDDSLDKKVVVLGASGVGKTCIALRYIEGVFSDQVSPTIGASFVTKNLIHSGVRVKLQIWDTAGQERFRSMSPMYYRGAAAAVLVFDVTQEASFKRVDEWVKELKTNVGAEILLLLVGNKVDMGNRSVSKETAMSYAQSIQALGYHEVSAKTGEGVNAAFMDIARTLVAMHVGEGGEGAQGGAGADSKNKAIRVEAVPDQGGPGERKKKKDCAC